MTEFAKAYDAKQLEPKWLKVWKNKFVANSKSDKPGFCIVIPPPNVTGALHMGHALVNTLQDVLIRWQRMKGREVLWVPGTDHAGIATQTIVEKKLIRETGKRRVDFEREEFLNHVWKWKDENENRIIGQLERLGASCDWSRKRFTMDEENNRAVRTIFKKLYTERLIYQGDYLVNWDPVTETALADDEVEYEENQGFIWTLKYPIKNSSAFITVATTRPETMLGDTAVAVSPKDERYQSLIGKIISHPLTGREIPIIADHFVDPAFGTGAVKITPAHDPNDYEMAVRHNLPFINIMTPKGNINENGGEFQGLSMSDAREKVIEALKNLGLLVKIDPHLNRVGVSYRSKAKIEPYISKQWFIKMSAFKESMRSAVKEERCKLIPKQWESTYFHWIDNLRDWCISRQLWWGHRIPIWYNKSDPSQIICYDGEGNPPDINPEEWEQDQDVLDTWFSSALWPFAALGWPENTPELKKFYPNAVLVTGHDILFFWVARMIMMGEYVMGKSPFPETFLHGLIFGKSYWRVNKDGSHTYVNESERLEYDLGKPTPPDVQFRWEKMSKSKGNVIDPIEIIDQYGTDALRMTMCSSGSKAREIDLDRRKFEDYKNFANKVWNGARFAFMQTEDLVYSESLDFSLLTLEDKWILSRLNKTIKITNDSLQTYDFDKATLTAYDFFWKEFCAYYVEICKPVLFGKAGDIQLRRNKQKLLIIILNLSLRLIHPMAPFITEELFALIKEKFISVIGEDPYTQDLSQSLASSLISFAPYPEVIRSQDIDDAVESDFTSVEQAVYTVRNLRGEMKLAPNEAPPLYIQGPENDPLLTLLKNHTSMLSGLVKTDGIHFTPPPENSFLSTGVLGAIKIMIPLPPERIEQEKNRLAKEKERLSIQIEKISQQLNNPDFVSRAPKALIEKNKEQISKLMIELEEVKLKLV